VPAVSSFSNYRRERTGDSSGPAGQAPVIEPPCPSSPCLCVSVVQFRFPFRPANVRRVPPNARRGREVEHHAVVRPNFNSDCLPRSTALP